MKEVDFQSFDGEIIKCYEFAPEGEIKGIVQIVHGLEEHGKRYSDFAKFLNKNGYLVFTCDQRLHGETAGENLSKTKIRDIYPVMVQDQCMISDMLIDKFNKPLIIMGHSYGSFVVQGYLQRYDKESGAILCGSAYMKRFDVLLGGIVAKLTRSFKGGEATAKAIEKIVYGGYNKQVGSGSWICANPKSVEKYEADPLCGQPLCANFYCSMFSNTYKLYKKKNLEKIDKAMPILIISGKDDPVGKMGKSTTKLYKCYKKHGLNAKLKLYEGMRHEILNEVNNQIVYNDILEFVNNVIDK